LTIYCILISKEYTIYNEIPYPVYVLLHATYNNSDAEVLTFQLTPDDKGEFIMDKEIYCKS